MFEVDELYDFAACEDEDDEVRAFVDLQHRSAALDMDEFDDEDGDEDEEEDDDEDDDDDEEDEEGWEEEEEEEEE